MASKRPAGAAPRQSDIGRMLGLSQATVSLVLSGRGDVGGVSTSTQERVLKAAGELGYVPDAAASHLAGGSSGLLGVYTFESVFPRDSLDFYYPFMVGIEEEAERVGVDLVLFTSAHSPRGRGTIFGQNRNRLGIADGAVLLGVHTNRDELARLRTENYPFVHIGRRELPGQEIAFVAADYAGATETVFEYLIGLGHRQVCYLAPTGTDEPTKDRELGYERATRRFPVSKDPQLWIRHEPDDLPIPEVLAAVERGATAFVTHHSSDARIIFDALQELGYTAGKDYSLAALDEPISMGQEGALLTGFHLPRREMGVAAVSSLIQLIESKNSTSPQVLMGCQFAPGDTCSPENKE